MSLLETLPRVNCRNHCNTRSGDSYTRTAADSATTTHAATKAENAIEINPILVNHAWLVAKARTRSHDGCRKPWQDLGADGNANVDLWGALGEVVLLDALFRVGLEPHGFELVADNAPAGPDFLLGSTRFHIKSVPPGKRYASINEAQRLSPHHACDFYLVAHFLTPKKLRVLGPVPAADVAGWELRVKHSAYRSIAADCLPVVQNLQEVAQ